MPHRLCSVCQIEGRLLERSSQDALVEYYRCDRCGRVWAHEKAKPKQAAQAGYGEGREAAPVVLVGHRHRLAAAQAAETRLAHALHSLGQAPDPMSEFT